MTEDLKGGIALRKAVESAKACLLSLEEDRLLPGPIQGVALEEFGQEGETGNWLITLGYRVKSPFDLGEGVAEYLSRLSARSEVFRVFTVDRHSGEVVKMTIREPRG